MRLTDDLCFVALLGAGIPRFGRRSRGSGTDGDGPKPRRPAREGAPHVVGAARTCARASGAGGGLASSCCPARPPRARGRTDGGGVRAGPGEGSRAHAVLTSDCQNTGISASRVACAPPPPPPLRPRTARGTGKDAHCPCRRGACARHTGGCSAAGTDLTLHIAALPAAGRGDHSPHCARE